MMNYSIIERARNELNQLENIYHCMAYSVGGVALLRYGPFSMFIRQVNE